MTRLSVKETTLDVIKENFRDRYTVNQNKCWVWHSPLFRFRHGKTLYNPRRLALQIAGYAIPAGRNVFAGACSNELCVNPDHARLVHNKLPLDPNAPLIIEPFDLLKTNKRLSKIYFLPEEAIQEARMATLRMIVEVKNGRLAAHKYATKYSVSETFILKMKKMSGAEFDMLKVPSHEIYDPEDEEEPDADPDLSKFVL